MIASVLDDDELASENSPMDLEKFDDDMSNMFKVSADELILSCIGLNKQNFLSVKL